MRDSDPVTEAQLESLEFEGPVNLYTADVSLSIAVRDLDRKTRTTAVLHIFQIPAERERERERETLVRGMGWYEEWSGFYRPRRSGI